MSADETRSAANASGCWKCGRLWVRFGGRVTPAIVGKSLREAVWWTDCPDCGYVEVRDAA